MLRVACCVLQALQGPAGGGLGTGTVWEHWGGNAHDYGGGSKNHPMFMGGLGVFLYDLAGLASTPDMDLATPDMAAGGGGSVVLAPGAGSRAAAELIGAASVSTVTQAGRVSFEWSYHAVLAAGAGAGAASAVVASANVTVPVGLALPVRLRLHPGQWGDGASGDTGCSPWCWWMPSQQRKAATPRCAWPAVPPPPTPPVEKVRASTESQGRRCSRVPSRGGARTTPRTMAKNYNA